MSVDRLNDAAILGQLNGQWEKVALFLLWKLAGREKVRITGDDMARCLAEFSPGVPVLLTHGHSDAIEFQVIDEAAAQRIAIFERQQRGHS